MRFIHEQAQVGAPRDLVQFLEAPTKALTHELMRQVDFVVVTGSQMNVRAAYSSGPPAIGVGLGNAPVIIDADADIADAVTKITQSKTFDLATSCSSENSLHVHSAVYGEAVAALNQRGDYLLSREEKVRLQATMWPDGRLSPAVTAKAHARIAEIAVLDSPEARTASFFMVAEEGVGQSSRSAARNSRNCRWY